MKTAGIATGIALLTLISISSCGSRQDQGSVPKPEAWPRIELPSTDYQTYAIGPAELQFNSSVQVETERKDNKNWWITARYPQYRTVAIYLTLSDEDTKNISQVIDNRRERMELNAGGATTIVTELTSAGGWHCELTETRTSLTTPIQLLATDSTTVLSGALYLNLPADTSVDSIAPIIGAVRDDMLFLLKNLRS